MKKKFKLNFLLTVMFVFVYFFVFSQVSTVKIGTQNWTTENLNVNKFRNGDFIKQAKTIRKWKKFGRRKKPAWCYYENKSKNGSTYGKLYNWYAVNDPRGLAPKGFHVPSDSEWIQLTEYLGGEDIAGQKMKATSGWKAHINNFSNGNNISGFTGLPGGYRYLEGTFLYLGSFGYWWSSTQDNDANAWYRDQSYNKSNASRDVNSKRDGLSVRCIKD